MKDIDADYYGYRDDDDGILIPLEHEAEEEGIFFTICLIFWFINLLVNKFTAVARAVAEWQAKKEAGLLELDKNHAEENIYTTRKLKVALPLHF